MAAPNAVFSEETLAMMVNPHGRPLQIDAVDANLLALAIKRMKAIVQGNGIDPASVTLDGFDGAIINFDARMAFEIRHQIAHKTMPGKAGNAEVVGTEADLHARIQSTIEQTGRDAKILNYATATLEKRKDQGFAVSNLVIRLDPLNKTFVHYNTCAPCSGAGKIPCGPCGGHGHTACHRCRGQRTFNCPACNGSGHTRNVSTGKTEACNRCHGKRIVACDACHQTGQMQCRACTGTGRVNCAACGASGRISDLVYVSFDAVMHFAYDLSDLPAALPPVIDRYGPALVADQHAELVILQGDQQQTWQDEQRTADHIRGDMILPYHARLPWGVIRIRCGDAILTGKMLGFNADLLDFPHFLEPMIAPAADRLAQAAHNVAVHHNLREASKARLVATSLLGAASLPPKRAFDAIRKRYPCGVGDETIETLIALSAQALAHLTRGARLLTIGGGAMISLAVFAVWFIGGLRDGLAPAGTAAADILIGAGLDLALVGGCALAIIAAMRAVTRHRVLSLIGAAMPPDRRKKFMPRTGKNGLVALACAVVACAVILAVTLATGAGVPGWMAAIGL